MIAVSFLFVGCGGDVTPLQAALDGLQLPPAWQTATTVVKGGETDCITFDDPYCPSVRRYFVVVGKLPDLFQQAKAAIVAEGFGQLEEFHPNCDLQTNGAPCSINATKGELQMEIDLYPPSHDVDLLGISVPDHATVRMTVRRT